MSTSFTVAYTETRQTCNINNMLFRNTLTLCVYAYELYRCFQNLPTSNSEVCIIIHVELLSSDSVLCF